MNRATVGRPLDGSNTSTLHRRPARNRLLTGNSGRPSGKSECPILLAVQSYTYIRNIWVHREGQYDREVPKSAKMREGWVFAPHSNPGESGVFLSRRVGLPAAR